MRIIAGEARGRAIIAPKGTDTRPTLDRVRESLFSILSPRLMDARVLDLFAGSGALGLESLSRGAAGAVFVDHARAAQAAIRQNIETLGYGERARLLPCDWRAALRALAAEGARFDLVFLDPPYRLEAAEAALVALWDGDLLADGGRIVFEHDLKLPPAPGSWAALDTRRYGDTAITFYTR